MINQQWIYRKVPSGVVGPEHYELVHTPVYEALNSGEARSQTWMPPHPLDTVQGRAVAPMLSAGKLQLQETLVQGFEQLPAALNQLFTGTQAGKVIVQVQS